MAGFTKTEESVVTMTRSPKPAAIIASMRFSIDSSSVGPWKNVSSFVLIASYSTMTPRLASLMWSSTGEGCAWPQTKRRRSKPSLVSVLTTASVASVKGVCAEIVAPAFLAARAAARWMRVSVLVGPVSVVAILIQLARIGVPSTPATAVDLYRSVSQAAPAVMARSAAAYVAAGYRRIQVKVGADPAEDVE